MAAILVVGEEVVTAHDLAQLIRQMGHTVDIAYSGEDALCAAEAGLEEREGFSKHGYFPRFTNHPIQAQSAECGAKRDKVKEPSLCHLL